MKIKYCIFIIMPMLLLYFNYSFGKGVLKDSSNTYLIISFQKSNKLNKNINKSGIQSKIESVFMKEGYHIIRIERPERYKLNVNIAIGDSLRISAEGTGVSESIITVRYPKQCYYYGNESDIYKNIKEYIEKNLK